MRRYDFVLFDADNTLFDFDRAEHTALALALEEFSIPCTLQTEALYLSINGELWARLGQGEVEQEWLVVERFAALCRALGAEADPAALNRRYLERLGEQAFLLPGALEVCTALAPRCTLAIITNGMAVAQRGRLARSPLAGLIDRLFISQELGATKPSPAFFRPVFDALGITDPARVLVVGDNLSTDIGGGAAMGTDTAWYNPAGRPRTGEIVPTWQVTRLEELLPLVLPKA